MEIPNPKVYENNTENRRLLNANREPALGNRNAKYIVHNETSGVTVFTQDKPKLEERVTMDHAREVCKIGQGHECCRYLTSSKNGWGCEKYGYFRTQLDWRVERTIAGVAGSDSINAQGDNCEGRQP